VTDCLVPRLLRHTSGRSRFATGLLAAMFLLPVPSPAQEPPVAPAMSGPLGIPHSRIGSGTSWLPDSSPMHALHTMWGDWTVMFHGALTLQYNRQGSSRGDEQLGLVDWAMLMAMRPVGTGLLHLHGMVSMEPATMGGRGYPLLLQSGETHRGEPLHDRQHPHDFLMELAAMYQQPLTSSLAMSLYAGLAGEPALGPVAYMHRPSAQDDPMAPLGHHWQDATHILFGVVTGGLYTRHWKVEGSLFNGREPDENRWNVDLSGRRLDSYAARVSFNPGATVSIATWYGRLDSPEALHPDDPARRYGASVIHAGRGIGGGQWATTLLWGANDSHDLVQHSALLETNLGIGARNAIFGRLEQVTKSASDLAIDNVPDHSEYVVRSAVLGYAREALHLGGLELGVGVRGAINFVPAALEAAYGTCSPKGAAIYLRLRARRATLHDGHAGHQMVTRWESPRLR
jgi:hypothetical protein